MAQDSTKPDGSSAPTLLDQFAIAALTGIYAAHRDTSQPAAGGHVPAEAASAMMKERTKQK